jgi:prolipoprotein diacylglyceryl transferase
MQHPLAFPSPSQGVWHLGPLPLRAYALMIILGIVVAVWLSERRWAARGGTPGVVIDIAVWAVPFGLVGGRLYHVITDNQMYFGAGRHPLDAFKVWNGGLGIWGAVALGALGAYIGCRRRGINLRVFADVVAPGIALAQGIGRWGNWFNQELYGRPTSLPWAVTIDQDHRPRLSDGSLDPRYADVANYHPTFLYESLWCLGVAILVIWAGKRFKLNYGRSFALYVAAYTVGRAWIEWLRIDNAHHFLGLRLNDYTALVVFVAAVAYLYVNRDKGDVEEVLETRRAESGGDGPVGEPEPLGGAGAVRPDSAGPAADGERAASGQQAPDRDRAPDAEQEASGEAEQGSAGEQQVSAEPWAVAEPAVDEPENPADASVDHGEPAEETDAQGDLDAQAEIDEQAELDEPIEEAADPSTKDERAANHDRSLEDEPLEDEPQEDESLEDEPLEETEIVPGEHAGPAEVPTSADSEGPAEPDEGPASAHTEMPDAKRWWATDTPATEQAEPAAGVADADARDSGSDEHKAGGARQTAREAP